MGRGASSGPAPRRRVIQGSLFPDEPEVVERREAEEALAQAKEQRRALVAYYRVRRRRLADLMRLAEVEYGHAPQEEGCRYEALERRWTRRGIWERAYCKLFRVTLWAPTFDRELHRQVEGRYCDFCPKNRFALQLYREGLRPPPTDQLPDED
ncbi:MAG: hypothetical protein HY335_01370 [Deinococcus sp.]|nr:hypothetical protein [Deinococcus sp.]